MYKNEGGIKGLYRGLVPTAAGVAPYVALNFACFESFKGMLTTEDGKPPGTMLKLLVGGVAGSISQTCTYPFDVLRRRMQVVGMKGLGYEYTGAWSATKTIVRTEGECGPASWTHAAADVPLRWAWRAGVKGLYKGILPNLLKVSGRRHSSLAAQVVVRSSAQVVVRSKG